MHCAKLLYILHVNNGEIEVGQDSRKKANAQSKCFFLAANFFKRDIIFSLGNI